MLLGEVHGNLGTLNPNKQPQEMCFERQASGFWAVSPPLLWGSGVGPGNLEALPFCVYIIQQGKDC